MGIYGGEGDRAVLEQVDQVQDRVLPRFGGLIGHVQGGDVELREEGLPAQPLGQGHRIGGGGACEPAGSGGIREGFGTEAKTTVAGRFASTTTAEDRKSTRLNCSYEGI